MRRSRKTSTRPLVRRPLVSLEYLEGREVPATAFALSGTNLLSFDTASPTLTQTTAITGITAGETLVGVDFRPQNGLLYGLGVDATADTATLYAISTRTGFAGVVGSGPSLVTFTTDGTTKVDLPDPATVGYGIDFNPAADRFRVVAGSLNFRANPNDGKAVDGDNTGLTTGTVTGTNPDGPTNTGTTTVDAAAYTNNQPNNGNVTTQYTLDAGSNSLFVQAPPNTGTQTLGQGVTLGGNPLDFTAVNGFDIPAGVNAPGNNLPVTTGSAFAVLNVGGTTGLYSINLVDATATLVGNVGNGATAVQGLAVQSDLGGIPAVALDAGGTNILRFNSATPGTVSTVPITGTITAGETLAAIDYRPATGQLYAIGIDPTAETGTLYLVTPQTVTAGVDTASVAAVGTFSFVQADGTTAVDLPDPAAAGYGMDFNPTVDRIRVTTSTGLNFRLNPNNGAAVDGNLNNTVTPPAGTNTDGNVNGTGVTGVSATAYTNSVGTGGSPATPVGTTTQYTLDAATDKLFIQTLPNSGAQTNPLPVTLGGNPLDFTDINGFDIPAGVRVATSNAPVASGFGYAALTVAGTTSLYQINLTTGAATSLGDIAAGATAAGGFALADAPAGTVSFAAATATVAEGGGTAAITLTRTGGTTGELTVTVNVTGGTALAGADFTAGPFTATFADGATTATINVPVTEDTTFEGNETVVLTIASVNNAGVIGTPNVSTLTITENDAQQTFAVTDAQGFALVGGMLSAFSSTNPGASLAPIALTGVTAGETLVAIDYRPQNGLLYGLGVDATADTATLYLISPRGGVATAVGTAGQIAFVDGAGVKVDLPDPATVDYDIDFNPAVDRVRVVAGALNFRVNPNDGKAVDGNLNNTVTPPAGVNTDGLINGQTTTVGGTAYVNNFPNNGGVTTQFTLDASTDKLFIQNPPNAGTQASGVAITVGGNPLDFTAVKGFDILAGVNAPASNGVPAAGAGLAVLTVGGSDILYRIDLTNGKATVLGPIGASPAGIDSIAFQSDIGLVPTISLVGGASPQLVRANATSGLFPVTVTGVAIGETLVGIDFRPQTGQLYGLGIDAANDKGTLYLIDPQSGAATAVGAGLVAFQDAAGVAVDLPDPATAGYGFDFNPAVDKVRVVTSTGLNFRVNPADGKALDGDLGGAAGSVANTNTDGNINGVGVTGASATAYTNDFGQPAGGKTTQYTLDDVTDSLYIQDPPNSGTQTGKVAITLGGNPLDFSAVNGFDIGSGVSVTASSAVAAGVGFANLTVGGSAGLYRIDLATGVAALVGTLGTTAFSGLATADTPAGTIAFTAAAFNKLEAGGTLDLTLTRTGGTSGPVTVTVTLTDGTATGGTDFTATPITVTFADGQTTATATVPLTDDAVDELDETFTATVTAPTNGAVIGAQATTTVTIIDDDGQPTVSVADAKVVEGNAGTSQLVFTVTLSNASSQTVTVTADTKDGTAIAGKDFTAVAGKLVTFAPGTTTQTVSIDVTGETIFEIDETFKLALSAPTNATLGVQPTAVGTITNDDTAPTVSINSVTVAEGDTGTKTATFTVTLSAASEVPVTVTVDTKDGTAKAGTDFTAVAGKVVTIAAGATTATFDVTVTGDTLNEADETFTAVLSSPTGATIATGTGTGTITNDDPAPTLTINDMATFEGNSGTTTLTFTVTLSGSTSQTVTVSVATANNSATAGTDYVALPATTLTFAPGTTTQTVTVTVNGDTTVENDETFLVQLSGATVATIADGTGFATIVNDDTPSTPQNKQLLVGVPNTAIGAASGVPTVRVIDAAGKQLSSGPGLPATFTGGVRTAVADVNGDGTPDIVVGSGPGSISLVRVLDGVTNKEIFTVQPFEGTFTGGVFVAAGDVNGDGFADIAISPDRGGGPRVDIYSGKVGFAKIDSFFGIDDPNFRGGARVAIGDINGDGTGDLAVAAGFQGGPRVAAFNGKTLGTATRVKLFNDFFAFEPTLRNGAFITVGDVNGDGLADIVAGGGPNGGPRVTAFNSATLISSGGGQLNFLANFFAGDPNTRTGVVLTVKDIDGDNKADLRTAVGGQDQILTFLGKDLTPTGTPPSTTLDGLPDFNGGVFVG